MGSSGGSASREAQQAEEERQRQIQQTQGRIEEVFSSPERQAQIDEYEAATRQFLMGDLDRTKADNDRQLKFALARSGLGGGSTAIDQGQNLAEDYLRAILEADRRAKASANNVRQSDQDAKLSLFNQALGGLNMGTAESNALQSMRQNLELGRNQTSEQNFDNFFSDYASIYKASRDADVRRREQQQFGGIYSPQNALFSPVSGGQSGGG